MPADSKLHELSLTGSLLVEQIKGTVSLRRWGHFATVCEILCAVILIGTAFLKLLSIAWDQPLLSHQDPIIPLTNRTVYAGVAVCELLIAFRIFVSNSSFEKCALLVWIALGFSVYRLGHWLSGVPEPCSCLGDALGFWPWLSANRHAASLAIFWCFTVLTISRAIIGYTISVGSSAEKNKQPQIRI